MVVFYNAAGLGVEFWLLRAVSLFQKLLVIRMSQASGVLGVARKCVLPGIICQLVLGNRRCSLPAAGREACVLAEAAGSPLFRSGVAPGVG